MTLPTNTTKTTKTTKTLVTLLLDRSGSMQAVKDDTLAALNGYLAELRQTEADIRFSLVLFDSHRHGLDLERVVVGEKVAKVRDLGPEDFRPRGSTPLIDAACSTIQAVEESLGALKTTPNVVIAIQTDGMENASREFRWDDLKALIARKEAQGWQFVFMGCGIDAYDQGRRMGLREDRVVSYGRERETTRAAFSAHARRTKDLAEGASAEIAFSPAEKEAAGDRWRKG